MHFNRYSLEFVHYLYLICTLFVPHWYTYIISRLGWQGKDKFSRYRVLGKIQIAEPVAGCHPGLVRNYLSPSVSDGVSSEIVFTLPRERMDLDTFQIHARYLLLDTVTGYR